ncbi:MAG: S1-like domain-containing RNA-binding protein [Thermodesulfobacteriota bacterium]|nr:S1-like domain-containing RNA-binding protein [Thermodesulfobacteriota bacterium]
MLVIGSYNELVVEREVEFGFYLNPKEHEVLLPSKYALDNLQPGDLITVFVYTDSEDRPVATTLTPTIVVGDFAFLQVKDVREFGAFLEWGLEKDLFLPNSEMRGRVNKGDKIVVKACLDEKSNRVYATAKITSNCEKDITGLEPGEKVDLLISGVSNLGFTAVIDKRFCGMLYRNETYGELAVGDKIEGFISRIREDGKIDLILKQPGYGSVADSSVRIVELLEKSHGFIACNDKSSPEKISELFSMSKKEFKRTIGGLYKKRVIEINDKGIRLLKSLKDVEPACSESDESPWAFLYESPYKRL